MISKIKAIDQSISKFCFQIKRAKNFYRLYQTDYVSGTFKIDSLIESFPANKFSDCIQAYQQGHYLEEYVVHYTRPCIIEPDKGWAIDGQRNTLIYESIGSQSWEIAPYPSYIKCKILPRQTQHYDTIVSLRMIRGGWNNYWHFMHDILGQLLLLEEHDLVKDYPILIPASLAQKQFFKDAVDRSTYLKNKRWIIQDGFYVETQNALFAQRMPHAKAHFNKLYDTLEVKNTNRNGSRKIFLTRGKRRGRTISNIEEIERIARSYAFKVIDTDTLSLHEQIETFANTRYIVGIHGAGLLNILFRQPAPLHLLEIFPLDYVQIHYYWLCQMYGYDYSALTGEDGESKGTFYLNPDKFEAKLKYMLG